MITKLIIDDDLAAALKAEARRDGRPFREVVNETLRRGLASKRVPGKFHPFKVNARDLGSLQTGLSLDNVAVLLEQIEGPLHR